MFDNDRYSVFIERIFHNTQNTKPLEDKKTAQKRLNIKSLIVQFCWGTVIQLYSNVTNITVKQEVVCQIQEPATVTTTRENLKR